MTEFDPLKAMHEELASLSEVLTVVQRAEHRAELAISTAEAELNAYRKIRGFVQIILTEKREKLRQIEEAKERK